MEGWRLGWGARATLGRSAYAALLVGGSGVLAWLSGHPFLFPSLGPTAYLMATLWTGDAIAGRRVVGGHGIGAVAGFLAHWLVAGGLTMTALPPAVSVAGARLAAAGALSVAATTGGMLATNTGHPPACATTLIVALGLLSSPADAGGILVAVAALYASHRAVVLAVGS